MHNIRLFFEKSYRLHFVEMITKLKVDGELEVVSQIGNHLCCLMGWNMCEVKAWPSTLLRRVEGKSFLRTFGKTFLHESMSLAFGKMLPTWSKVTMLCVFLIIVSLFAMVSSWIVAIPCQNKILK